MRQYLTRFFGLMWVVAALTASVTADAEPDRHSVHHRRGMDEMRHHSGGEHRHHEHHMRHHGSEESAPVTERHEHHDKEDTRSSHWRRTLTEEQRAQIDGLRVTHVKFVVPLRAKIHAAKADLAVLATADEPDSASIQNKLDELLEMKKQLLRERYEHLGAVRKVLSPEQRMSFDTMVMKKLKRRGKHRVH